MLFILDAIAKREQWEINTKLTLLVCRLIMYIKIKGFDKWNQLAELSYRMTPVIQKYVIFKQSLYLILYYHVYLVLCGALS